MYYGKTDYLESLHLQKEWIQKAQQTPSLREVLGFEFDPVITLGKRACREEDVKENWGTPVVEVPRGGQATFHSPGQLVIYPICNIRFYRIPIKFWVQQLLQHTQNTLEDLCSSLEKPLKNEGTGIFMGPKKVVSIGLRIDRGVSSFGLAINLRNQVELFKQIRPCGKEAQPIGHLNYQGELKEAFETWCQGWEKGFSLGVDKTAAFTQFETSFDGI